MKVYRIEISSNREPATNDYHVSANSFGEALKKAKRLSKKSLLFGQKRISKIEETVTKLR